MCRLNDCDEPEEAVVKPNGGSRMTIGGSDVLTETGFPAWLAADSVKRRLLEELEDLSPCHMTVHRLDVRHLIERAFDGE